MKVSNFIQQVDFSQAEPPEQPNRGNMGPRFVQQPMGSEAPATGFVEAPDEVTDQRIRGYRETPIGGSAQPGVPNAEGNSTEKSQASGPTF
jgi:hypothetical protein